MERIPVEVWQKILRLAIACPLLPPDEEYNHHHIQTMAEMTCVLFAEYKQSERTRTNLRLVCSSWNEFLEQYSDRLVRLSPYVPDGYWPPVKCWDRVVRLEAPRSAVRRLCCRSCWPSSYGIRPSAMGFDKEQKMEAAIKDIYLPLLGNRCRAIIYPTGWRSELERLDHIELLNQDIFVNPAVHLSALTKYTNLRHLQISLPTLINPSAHIELPSLKNLSILLESHLSGSGVPTPILPSHIGIWNLPRLHYLGFNSHMYAWDIEVFILLLGQVGKTIVRFHLGENLRTLACTRLVDKIWDSSPSLGYLEIGMFDLLQMPGPPNDHHSRSVNVFVDTRDMWSWRYGPPPELIAEFPTRWASGRLGEVRLETTWERFLDRIPNDIGGMGMQLSLSSPSNTSRDAVAVIFEILHTTGKGLTDCDGAPFDNEVRVSILSLPFELGGAWINPLTLAPPHMS